MRQTRVELYTEPGGRFNFLARDVRKLGPNAIQLMVDRPINYSVRYAIDLYGASSFFLLAYWGQLPKTVDWPTLVWSSGGTSLTAKGTLWWKVGASHLLPNAKHWGGCLTCDPNEVSPVTIMLFVTPRHV